MIFYFGLYWQIIRLSKKVWHQYQTQTPKIEIIKKIIFYAYLFFVFALCESDVRSNDCYFFQFVIFLRRFLFSLKFPFYFVVFRPRTTFLARRRCLGLELRTFLRANVTMLTLFVSRWIEVKNILFRWFANKLEVFLYTLRQGFLSLFFYR